MMLVNTEVEIRNAILYGIGAIVLLVTGGLLWIDFKGILSWIFP
jgi:hypothetical protein